MATYIPCPRCTKNWVDEDDGIVCAECRIPLMIDTKIFDVYRTIQEVDKLDFNKFTSQHRSVLERARDKLEAMLNVLERYPKRH